MGRSSIKARPPAVAPTRYQDDLFTWVAEQVALLRTGRLDEIDALNVAEELSDVGNEQYEKLESAIAVLAQHLLKWDHLPKLRSRSWELSVREHRRRIEKVLRKNPGLKAHIPQAIEDGYADGRDRALAETGFADDLLPEECPYSFNDLMTRDLELEPAPKRRKR